MDYNLPGSYVHGISPREHWSGLPFPFQRNLPDQGIELTSPALAGRFFTTKTPGKPKNFIQKKIKINAKEQLHFPIRLLIL